MKKAPERLNKERKAILRKVHLKLLQEVNGKHVVTKAFVFSVMETYGIQLFKALPMRRRNAYTSASSVFSGGQTEDLDVSTTWVLPTWAREYELGHGSSTYKIKSVHTRM